MSTEPKAYVIVMSRGQNIPIDAEEVALVLDAIQNGHACKVKRGLFNPSFYVNIVEDSDRIKEFRQELARVKDHNWRDKEYNGGKLQKEIPVFKKLDDIFAEVPLQLDNGRKRLN